MTPRSQGHQSHRGEFTTLHSAAPTERPPRAKPHLTGDGSGAQHKAFPETQVFSALPEVSSHWRYKRVHARTAGTLCADPTAPTRTHTHKPTGWSRKVWVSFIDSCLHARVFCPGAPLPAQARSPLEGPSRARAGDAGCTSLAGTFGPAGCNPSRWNSAGCLRHRGGGRGGSLPQGSHLSPGLLSPSPSPPRTQDSRGAADQAHPPSRGRPSHLGRLYAIPLSARFHCPPRPPPPLSISLMMREGRPLPL